MNADTLVDTNIIVYAFDRDEPEKRKKALAAVLALQNEGSATISNQILAEVFSVLSGKKTVPLEEAETIIQLFAASPAWKKVAYTERTVVRAAAIKKLYGAPFWDALIAATIEEQNISLLLTENTKHFARIPFVQAKSPFV